MPTQLVELAIDAGQRLSAKRRRKVEIKSDSDAGPDVGEPVEDEDSITIKTILLDIPCLGCTLSGLDLPAVDITHFSLYQPDPLEEYLKIGDQGKEDVVLFPLSAFEDVKSDMYGIHNCCPRF